MQFINEATQKAREFAEANASVLLTAGGVVGTVATAVLSARAGSKATIRIADEAKNHPESQSPIAEDASFPFDFVDTKTKVLVGAPYFIPPIIVGTATIGSIIMGHRVSAARAAALAAAYGLAERNLTEYREKVTEKLTGPKKQSIEEELSQDRVNRTDGYQTVVVVGDEVLCFDEPTGRYFRSNMEKIRAAVNKTNEDILHSGWTNATYFYHELGMPATSWTDDMGWNTDQLIELKYDTVTSPDGRPCLAIDFNVLPKPDFIPKNY